jgi:hypothetical protein
LERKKAPHLHLESEHFQAVEMQKHSAKVWIYQIELPLDRYLGYNYASWRDALPEALISMFGV